MVADADGVAEGLEGERALGQPLDPEELGDAPRRQDAVLVGQGALPAVLVDEGDAARLGVEPFDRGLDETDALQHATHRVDRVA